MDSWVRLINKAEVIGLDTESTGLDVYFKDGDEALGFSISFTNSLGTFSEYFPIGHTRGPNLEESQWRIILTAVLAKPVVLHNSIHDLAVLHYLGYNIDNIKFYDTLKLGHLINENEHSYSLDNTTDKWLGYKGKEKSPIWELALHTYGWDMPSSIMHDYARTDAVLPLKVLTEMTKHKEFPKLNKYWKDIEAPTLRILSKMRMAGVLVDTERCRMEQERGEERMAEIEDELEGKPSSPLFLKRVLIDELGFPQIIKKETGKITFDKAAMARYDQLLDQMEGENDLAKRVAEYRGWQKSVSGYYIPYQRLVSSDGRLRAEYKSHGTHTGRFSCSNPNMQQIPKETNKEWNKNVKPCLIARPGYRLWEFDYAQLEFRLAASASKEKRLIDIFADPNRDIFNEMASDLGMLRDPTKTLNYTLQFGGGKDIIAERFRVTTYEAEDIIYNYFDTYPNLKRATQFINGQAKANGYVEIWSGRRRHFKYPKEEYYKAFNSYIQGGAADLVKTVMVAADKEGCNNEECLMLLQVHDSLVFEIEIGKEQYYKAKIIEIMTRPDFGVKLAVDAHEWSKN